ncbi:MAG: redoxin domain-containing protein [Ignavibacteriales bacterium]|nr:redoxin domain-containing protein [Ignavibacteriales bacterium]
MRVPRIFPVLALITALVTGSQSLHGQLVSIVPQNPRIHDSVKINYNAGAQNAAIRRPAALTLRTLVLRDLGSQAVLVETPMEKSGNIWKATVSLKQDDARYLVHEFVSGDLKDDNGGKGWGTLVVGPDGKSLRAGRYWRAALLAFGGYMGYKFEKNVAAAKSELVTERKLFPEDYSAVNLAWYLETNPAPTKAGTALVKRELVNALKQFRRNDDALPTLLVWFDQVGEKKKADSLRTVFIAENPKGKVAASTRLMGLSVEKDPAKKIKLLEQHLSDFPLKSEEATADRRQLVMLYIQTGDYDKAYAVLKSSSTNDPALYKNLAVPMIAKGAGEEKAASWLSEGIDAVRKQEESSKPASLPLEDWKRARSATLAALLQTRGQAYSKLGKHDAAEKDFAEAYVLTRGTDLSVNFNLIEALLATNKYQKAEELGFASVSKGNSNLKIVEKFKAAYSKVHGSLNGYDKAVQEARIAEQSRLMKDALSTPAPEFSLRSVEGGQLKLEELRGKVLVVTFWATWCGTSREALPQVQKVFEAYQYYRTVSFLTINTAENAAGAARDTLIKKSMTGMKCTIPTGLDETAGVEEKFGIEGVPTTYVIDRNGTIRFKHVGFKDGNELVKDLTKEIEVLLKR